MARIQRWLAALLRLGLIVTICVAPARAAEETGGDPGAAPGEQQIRDLIAAIEDPAQRERLIANLQTLLEAQAQAQDPGTGQPEDAVGRLLSEVNDRTAVVRQVVRAVVHQLDRVPELGGWLEAEIRDPTTREVWIRVASRVVLVLGLGTLAALLVGLGLRRLRADLLAAAPASILERVPLVVLWLVVELLPVVALALVAYTIVSMFNLTDMARRVVLPLIHAVIIVRSGVALIRVLLAPKAPGLRLLPLESSGASFATFWSRRLLAVWVYGWFGLQAGRELGLPWALHGLLLHALFLSIAIMTIVMILKARQPVAAWIAGFGEVGRSRALQRVPWASLARIWHVLALLYVSVIFLVWALRIPGGFTLLLQSTLGTVAVVLAGWALWRLLDGVFKREMPQPEADSVIEPGLERRAYRYLPALLVLARAMVIVLVLVGLLEVWGFGTLRWLFSEAGNTFLSHLLTVAVIVAVTLVVWEVISLMIERSITEKDAEGNLKLSNRTRTLLNIMRNFLLVFLSLIALFLILSDLGLDIAPLLAGAGVVGLAIGFGSQRLVQDIITGMFVLLGDTIRVGDVVEIAARTGVVEEVTMRTVQLRDLSGKVHTIPYSAIDTVTNYTKDFSYAVFDIGVAYRENVDEVMEVLRTLGEEINADPYFRRLILEPLEMLGVDAFADSAVIIKARFKTRPLKQWEVGREFKRRIKNRFDELGIEIPFPHQTLYFGADKEGGAPPARIRVEASSGAEDVITTPEKREEQAAEPPEERTAAQLESARKALARSGGG